MSDLVRVPPEGPGLAARETPSVDSPAILYLASLGTPASRRTGLCTLRRLATLLEAGNDLDAWRRVSWGRLGAIDTTRLHSRLALGNPSTLRLTLSVLRGVLHQAFRLQQMSAEELQRAIELPKTKASRITRGRMLEDTEVSKLQEAAAARGPRSVAILACALGGGLRRAEIAELNAEALGADGVHLRLIGKGNKERIQPLPAWAGTAVARWVTVRETHSRLFGEISAWGVWSEVRAIREASGVAHFTPHDLRRTFASNMLEATDLPTTQRLMGHENPETTALYDRRGAKASDRAVQALDKWGPAPRPETMQHPITGQTIVNRRQAQARGPSFVRRGKPVTREMLLGQIEAMRSGGFSDAQILRALAKGGVTQGDGAPLTIACLKTSA